MSDYHDYVDYLKDKADDVVEYERFQRDLAAVDRQTRTECDGFTIIREDGLMRLWTIETEWLTDRQIVRLAHALLDEVEGVLRDRC